MIPETSRVGRTMITAPLVYSLNDAADETGEDRNLITFLVQDRQIPHRVMGRTKVIDAEGLRMLREALADYRSKAAAS